MGYFGKIRSVGIWKWYNFLLLTPKRYDKHPCLFYMEFPRKRGLLCSPRLTERTERFIAVYFAKPGVLNTFFALPHSNCRNSVGTCEMWLNNWQEFLPLLTEEKTEGSSKQNATKLHKLSKSIRNNKNGLRVYPRQKQKIKENYHHKNFILFSTYIHVNISLEKLFALQGRSGVFKGCFLNCHGHFFSF